MPDKTHLASIRPVAPEKNDAEAVENRGTLAFAYLGGVAPCPGHGPSPVTFVGGDARGTSQRQILGGGVKLVGEPGSPY